MMKILCSFTAFLLLITVIPAEAQRKKKAPRQSVNFIIEELAQGVWAAIQNDAYGKAICNAGIIDIGDQTVVFDPFMNISAAEELKDFAEYLTGKPVTLVVNSHFHSDHIRGNQVFRGAQIIGTKETREAILYIEPDEQEWESRNAPTLLQAMKKRINNAPPSERTELAMWIGYYEGMMESAGRLHITPPTLIFQDSLWIHGSRRSIKLVEYKDCHTASDAVLLLPEDRIAFMGDLLVNDRHPWLSDGDIVTFREVVKQFSQEKDYDVYVPGHGPVGKKEDFTKLYHYLSKVHDICVEASTDSLRQVLLAQPIPAPFDNWMHSRFYQPNLQYVLSKMYGIKREEE